jgi:hypothetical protein
MSAPMKTPTYSFFVGDSANLCALVPLPCSPPSPYDQPHDARIAFKLCGSQNSGTEEPGRLANALPVSP